MDAGTLAVIGCIVGGAGLGLSLYNTVRQVRRDQTYEQPRLVVTAQPTFRQDDVHPFALTLRIANAGFRPVQVVAVRFEIDSSGFINLPSGIGALAIPQLEPPKPLPALLGENESIALDFDPANFAERRQIVRAQVEDALGNLYRGEVPQWAED